MPYLVFQSVAEALVLIFPTVYAMTGGLLLQWLFHYNFSVAVGYIVEEAARDAVALNGSTYPLVGVDRDGALLDATIAVNH
jgi:hypothetical protein